MAKRTTNIGVNVESIPANKVRTTSVGANVEYTVPNKVRTSNIGVSVESIPANKVRTTDIGANVEYIDKYQYAYPVSDISKVNWTQFAGDNDANAFDELDEGFGPGRGTGAPDDDTTMWHTDSTQGVSRTIECKVKTVIDPTVHHSHVIRARVSKNSDQASPAVTGVVSLVQGTTVIASSPSVAITGTAQQTIEYTLSEAEAASITDYSDLRVRYVVTIEASASNRRCRVSTLELQVPVPTTLLVVAETYHAHVADNLTLTPGGGGGATLVVEDATHTHVADNTVLTAHASLSVADANHDHTADNVTLDSDSTLVVSESSHVHVADNVVLVTNSDLTVSDSDHILVSDNVTLGAGQAISVDDADHLHAVDNVTLVTNSDLVSNDSSHLHFADSIVLTTNSDLVVNESSHVTTSDNITLAFHAGMQVDDLYHLLVSDNIDLIPTNYLEVNDGEHTHLADNVTLSTQSLINVFSSVHLHSADNVVINVGQLQLFVNSAFHEVFSDNAILLEFKEADPNRIYVVSTRNSSMVGADDRRTDVNQSDRVYNPIRRT